MKKLSTLIAIALIVTIGGVYAAWNYSQGTTASLEVTREVQMAQVVTSGNKGTISATPNSVAFIVDDAGSYVAELEGSGSFTINFTENPGADETTATNGIKMIATVTLKTTSLDGAKYEGAAPITVKAKNTIALNPDGEGNAQPCKNTSISAAQIVGCLILLPLLLTLRQRTTRSTTH